MLISAIGVYGQSAVIGPMAISIVSMTARPIKALDIMGYDDLIFKDCINAEELITALAYDYKSKVITIDEIDDAIMNQLENTNDIIGRVAKKMISHLTWGTDKIVIDTPLLQRNPYLVDLLKPKKIAIISKDESIESNIMFTCATILAYKQREKIIKQLHKTYGDFGSGFIGNHQTEDFLRHNFDKYPIFRKSCLAYKKVVRDAYRK